MDQLLTRYHVNSDLAFFLARPMFNHQISLKCDEMREKDPKGWKNDKERNYEGYVQGKKLRTFNLYLLRCLFTLLSVEQFVSI